MTSVFLVIVACHADVLLELANSPVRQHLEQGATAGVVGGKEAAGG